MSLEPTASSRAPISPPSADPAVSEKVEKTKEEVGYFERGVLWLKDLVWKVILAVMRFFGFWKEEAQASKVQPVEGLIKASGSANTTPLS